MGRIRGARSGRRERGGKNVRTRKRRFLPAPGLCSLTSEQKPLTLSAGIVVVRRARRGWRYLLLRAYTHWDFPKGLVESGEDPLAAACREVEEETGLAKLHFRWGKEYIETGPYGQRKIARYYLAEALAPDTVRLPLSPELGRPEHDEFRWMSYGEARRLVGERVAAVLKWAQRRLNDAD